VKGGDLGLVPRLQGNFDASMKGRPVKGGDIMAAPYVLEELDAPR
jgi:hypothetical protein